MGKVLFQLYVSAFFMYWTGPSRDSCVRLTYKYIFFKILNEQIFLFPVKLFWYVYTILIIFMY